MTNTEADPSRSEQLVQRFIDNELSGTERLQLLTRLGHDEALRDRLIELEQLGAAAGRLPRPAVPADFVARVMERTTSTSSVGQRLRDAFRTPHGLEWNLAGALGAACVGLLIVGASITFGPSRQPALMPVPTVGTATPSTRVLVRLVMLQPGARRWAWRATSTDGIPFRLRWSPRRAVLGPSPCSWRQGAMSTCSL